MQARKWRPITATSGSIPIDVIRRSNEQADSLKELVGVFVGGTNGIGENTLREFFDRTTRPKAYIIGRSEEKARKIIKDVTAQREGAECHFIKCDITLLKNVDEACREIVRKQRKIHVLFLTAGYLTLKGRSENSEGIDRKMCVNYYARMRFIHNLLPQLAAAARENELSRVLSVLAAGSEGEIHKDDLGLKHNFGLHACLAHCVVMTDFMMEELAKRYPGTAFSHSYPGTVKSGITNQLPGSVRLAVKVLYAVSSPWILQLDHSGERHFFQITSAMYPPRRGNPGIPIPEGYEVCKGSDGTTGGGGYLLDWDAQATGNQSVLQPLRDEGFGQKIWDHTIEVFTSAVSRKRVAEASIDSPRPRDPPGWRPG
ncbi:hypothetical protein K461DRAFT_286106 [Myriangium duriaei CBS 260.36]|uniref:Uncharacterized protein n=1 Tax=Myriangium duriaei CBS 260.36 TaxID=1168546 RepID=A0A9P4MHM4_9PEZI|nr:hypothetical protein K461DRAFT_286106 [Myriangium duriaei CBS 260.36]